MKLAGAGKNHPTQFVSRSPSAKNGTSLPSVNFFSDSLDSARGTWERREGRASVTTHVDSHLREPFLEALEGGMTGVHLHHRAVAGVRPEPSARRRATKQYRLCDGASQLATRRSLLLVHEEPQPGRAVGLAEVPHRRVGSRR